MFDVIKDDLIEIRDVWSDNLEFEFEYICKIVDDFSYISTDTEFPVLVLRQVKIFDMVKLIQLGLIFSDEDGNLPTWNDNKYCVWKFNFKEFNVNHDIFAQDSIELVVLNDNVHWVTFHSGYDFRYLMKMPICRTLSDSLTDFFNLIKVFLQRFVRVYDIKHLMKYFNILHSRLNKLE
ncbi:hypothetical protein MKX01_041745 [Papaver californicum]|nr:hypothetical protein MKX01_041745 [Papaver californicum]